MQSLAGAEGNEQAFRYYKTILGIPDLKSKWLNETLDEIVRIASVYETGRAVYSDQGGKFWSYKPARRFVSLRKELWPLPTAAFQLPLIV